MVDCNIDIGDLVYIGGIIGDEFKIINNKVGEIKRVMFSSDEYYTTYLVDVIVNGEIFPVNLNYIYKIDDLDTYEYASLFIGNSSPLDYYFKLYNTTGKEVMLYDQYGQNYLYCQTKDNYIKQLVLTSLN